jgi:hypothetical protein
MTCGRRARHCDRARLTAKAALAAVLLVVTAVFGTAPAPAVSDTARWADDKCDVQGYDWYRDMRFSDRCGRVDILWVEAGLSGIAMTATVKYDYRLPYRFSANEPQRIWIQTNRDRGPEYLIKGYPNSGELRRVARWSGDGRLIRCDGSRIRLNSITEKLNVEIPATCLRTPRRIRVSVMSLNLSDDDKSWEGDYFPARRRWSARL